MAVIGLHHSSVPVAGLERFIASYEAVFRLRVAGSLGLGAERFALLEAGSAPIELIAAALNWRIWRLNP